MDNPPYPRTVKGSTEWPTLGLAAFIYLGWGCLTYWANALAWWIVLPLGAWLTAWHMSLQHEVIHGHPTHTPWLNDLIGSVPLSPWLPYLRYKRSHLGHHAGILTDPLEDPESQYVTAADYHRRSLAGRLILDANATLLGRLTIGPLRGVWRFLLNDVRLVWGGDRRVSADWLLHLPGLALIVGWLVFCQLSPARFTLLFLYPGFALALIRSFAEHRAADEADHRTAIVEETPIFGLLFLHNNLHVVHHGQPGLPWYRIPAAYAAARSAFIAQNAGLVYKGYREVARKYLLRQHDAAWHS